MSVTGYERDFYRDVGRIADALDPKHDRGVVALERIAEALERIATQEAEPRPTMPIVDASSSTQNAWVQDWLTSYFGPDASARTGNEWDAYELVIECIQERYSHPDHEAGR